MKRFAIELTQQYIVEVEDDEDMTNEQNVFEVLQSEYGDAQTSNVIAWEVDDEGLYGDTSDRNESEARHREYDAALAALADLQNQREARRKATLSQ